MLPVCILITTQYPYKNGETFIENEIGYLSNSFAKVFIFSLYGKKDMSFTRPVPSNVEVIPVGCTSSKLRYLKYALLGLGPDEDLPVESCSLKSVASLYAKGRSHYIASFICNYFDSIKVDFDKAVIYSYWFTDQAIAAWKVKGYFADKDVKAVAVSRAHGYDLYWERNVVGFLPYQDVSLQKLDGVFPCSDNGSEYLKKKYCDFVSKIATSRLGTVDNGLGNFVQGKECMFVTCSNLISLKRVDLFTKAFVLLSQKNTNIRWVCIGDGPMKAEIEKTISYAGIADKVEFKGRVANKDVLDFYHRNSVNYFCNVSSSEGLPVSIMEAMSFGIPCIATNVGGTGELVNDTNGRILKADITAEELAEVMYQEIMLDEEQYLAKRQQARADWERDCAADKNYTKWCEMLSEMVGNRC